MNHPTEKTGNCCPRCKFSSGIGCFYSLDCECHTPKENEACFVASCEVHHPKENGWEEKARLIAYIRPVNLEQREEYWQRLKSLIRAEIAKAKEEGVREVQEQNQVFINHMRKKPTFFYFEEDIYKRITHLTPHKEITKDNK